MDGESSQSISTLSLDTENSREMNTMDERSIADAIKQASSLSANNAIPLESSEADPLLPRRQERAPQQSLLQRFTGIFRRRVVVEKRVVPLSLPLRDDVRGSLTDSSGKEFPPNVIRNQRYHWYSFVFLVLFEQFKMFSNLWFLGSALSQIIPILRIGLWISYAGPLAFVLMITLMKELYDDVNRYRRDKEINNRRYERMTGDGSFVTVTSAELKVGHLVRVHAKQRVPADMVLLRTTNRNGATFIKTDQLDGETDWKLRHAVHATQELESDADVLHSGAVVEAAEPILDIYKFVGQLRMPPSTVEALSLDNTLWQNTTVTSGTALGVVIYTGSETRAVMNTSLPKTKVGLLDLELNSLTKVLFVVMVALSFVMIAVKGFTLNSPVYFFRYILLFSAIIPISMRVNLDMAKTLYSILIMRDKNIPNTVVRTSTIPEELGRISYLLTDKTGTLTQNDMVFQKLHLGRVAFSKDSVDEVREHLRLAYSQDRRRRTRGVSSAAPDSPSLDSSARLRSGEKKIRRTVHSRVLDAILSIALCHNVTPVADEEEEEGEEVAVAEGAARVIDIVDGSREEHETEANLSKKSHASNVPPVKNNYQASSPDEIALVRYSSLVGLRLADRDFKTITLENPDGTLEVFDVLQIFPFSSERKRMGIIVRSRVSNTITFYMKGADVVMSKIVKFNDWLDEECGNMARDGLRTLVFGKRDMSEIEYSNFEKSYSNARASMHDRDGMVARALQSIEENLELVGLTGVEDKLQHNVRGTLEMLRNAGVKIWMLTGDKIETATCIAISSKLVSRNQNIYTLVTRSKQDAQDQLNSFAQLRDTALIIDGQSLALCMENFEADFARLAGEAPAVVCCRCSPTQKADIVIMIKKYSGKQTCAIGDGGNDVSMIQAADVGMGIVGKEGKQASLASDFSVTQFSFICRLILWHGRNSYHRSARLGQFVIHRGLVISFLQAAFSACFYWTAISVYNAWLLVGFATVFTALPVFALVFDEDVTEELAFQFPELYWDLQKGRALSYKTFFTWLLISIYQGTTIMLLCVFLQEALWVNIVGISICSLVFTELINVAFEIRRWHRLIVLAEVLTVLMYIATIFLLRDTFEVSFILSWRFLWKMLTHTLASLVTAVSCFPVYLAKGIQRRISPPVYEKINMDIAVRKRLIILGCFLITLLSGTTNSLNVLSTDIQKGLQLSETAFAVLSALSLLGMFFVFPAGWVSDKFGPLVTAILGTALHIISLFLSSFCGTYTIYIGLVLAGFGAGATFMAALSCSMLIADEGSGKEMSIVTSGLSLSALVVSLSTKAFLEADECNHENCWRSSLRFWSILASVSQIIGCALLGLYRKSHFPRDESTAKAGIRPAEVDEDDNVQLLDDEPHPLAASATEVPRRSDTRPFVLSATTDAVPRRGAKSEDPRIPAFNLFGTDDDPSQSDSDSIDQFDDSGHAADPRYRIITVRRSLYIFKKRYFWALFAGYGCSFGTALYVLTHLVQLTDVLAPNGELNKWKTFLLPIWSLSTTFSNIATGFVLDFLEKRGIMRRPVKVLVIVMFLFCCLFLAMAVVNFLGPEGGIPPSPVFVFLIGGNGFAFGVYAVMFPLLLGRAYGSLNFGKFFSFLQIATSIASQVFPTIASIFHDYFPEHGFGPMNLLCTFCLMLCGLLLYTVRPPAYLAPEPLPIAATPRTRSNTQQKLMYMKNAGKKLRNISSQSGGAGGTSDTSGAGLISTHSQSAGGTRDLTTAHTYSGGPLMQPETSCSFQRV